MTLPVTEVINEEKVIFMMALAHGMVGGQPSLGFDPEHNDYIVVSTCDCESCKEFMNTAELLANTSVVLAVKGYVDARIKFLTAGGGMKNETKH